MENNLKSFTIRELEQIVKFTYEVGYCDGIESVENESFKEYKDADDFWNINKEKWINEEITYIF